jgi:hypothetical protein
MLQVIFHNPPLYWVSTQPPLPSIIIIITGHNIITVPPFRGGGGEWSALSHTNRLIYGPVPSAHFLQNITISLVDLFYFRIFQVPKKSHGSTLVGGIHSFTNIVLFGNLSEQIYKSLTHQYFHCHHYNDHINFYSFIFAFHPYVTGTLSRIQYTYYFMYNIKPCCDFHVSIRTNF